MYLLRTSSYPQCRAPIPRLSSFAGINTLTCLNRVFPSFHITGGTLSTCVYTLCPPQKSYIDSAPHLKKPVLP